jgi:hypothetical protein
MAKAPTAITGMTHCAAFIKVLRKILMVTPRATSVVHHLPPALPFGA